MRIAGPDPLFVRRSRSAACFAEPGSAKLGAARQMSAHVLMPSRIPMATSRSSKTGVDAVLPIETPVFCSDMHRRTGRWRASTHDRLITEQQFHLVKWGGRMRLAALGLHHESNTFSPMPGDLDQFRRAGVARGAQIVDRYATSHATMSGFLEAGEVPDVD